MNFAGPKVRFKVKLYRVVVQKADRRVFVCGFRLRSPKRLCSYPIRLGKIEVADWSGSLVLVVKIFLSWFRHRNLPAGQTMMAFYISRVRCRPRGHCGKGFSFIAPPTDV